MSEKVFTMKDAKLVELRESEKLRAEYEKAIEQEKRGEKVDYVHLLLCEKMVDDAILEALKKVPYSEDWKRYISNPILLHMAEEIVRTPCPDYTRYYGVRAKYEPKKETENDGN